MVKMAPAKSKKSDLGRSLTRRKRHDVYTSTRHSTDTDGPNLVSVTETTSLDDFLSNAEAAKKSFEAERGHAAIANVGVALENSHKETSLETIDECDNEDFCSIPKKPPFLIDDTAETFQEKETETFLDWKRRLARIQEKHPNLPPFEKNLEFWRQLWKIVELSDVIVQVVDARDPFFYYSTDLAAYAKEVDDKKENVVLLNKADLLSHEQRTSWAKYLNDSDTKAVFFSASEDFVNEEGRHEGLLDFGCTDILQPDQVLEIIKRVMPDKEITVGFTGYPNVGKSSTINRFLTSKKLKVSATPGKTKHFQTHLVGDSCTFIDGPGLVIPNLKMDKASMVLNGILPIDNLTDFKPSMDLLLTKVPLSHLLKHYGIIKSCVLEAKRSDRKMSTSMLFLSAFGLMRGLVKAGATPDHARAARIILKDFVQGRLRYCRAPPSCDQYDFCDFHMECDEQILADEDLSLEDSFPELKLTSGVHVRGKAVHGKAPMAKRVTNKKKREKARRIYKETPYA